VRKPDQKTRFQGLAQLFKGFGDSPQKNGTQVERKKKRPKSLTIGKNGETGKITFYPVK